MSLDLRFWRRRAVRPVLQSENSECALACISMISNYWGSETNLLTLRRQFAFGQKGATLANLVEMAAAMKMTARPVSLELSDLKHLATPAILHWNLNHFVVLERVTAKGARIVDPATGTRSVSISTLDEKFSGVAVELKPSGGFRRATKTEPVRLRDLTGRIAGLKSGLLKLFFLALAVQILVLLSPFYLQIVIDEVVMTADLSLLTVLALSFALLVLLQTGLSAMRTWFTTTIAADLNFQWLGNVFRHLLRLPVQYFEARHLGDISSRFDSIFTVQRALTADIVEGGIDLLLVLGTATLLFFYDTTLGTVALIGTAAYAFVKLILFEPSKRAMHEAIIHGANQKTNFLETIRNIQAVKLTLSEVSRHLVWQNRMAKTISAELTQSKYSIVGEHARNIIFALERVLIVWLAARMILAGSFSVGMLFAFLAYKDQFSVRCSSLIDKALNWRMLRLHAERIAEITLTEEESFLESQVGSETKIPEPQSALELRDISFRYSTNDKPVLNGLNLKVSEGECLVITGASGEGKTTLLKIILGLYQPDSGEVLIRGKDLRQIGIHSFRKNVGAVMQDDHLFTGSISENISGFDPSPDQEQVTRCASIAGLIDDINNMPMRFDTLIGEIGSGISGGQQQRMLLARALYRNPQILVLDEATSHLDTKLEKQVNEALRGLEVTRILVAHREETIKLADRILSISEGHLSEIDRDKAAQIWKERNGSN